MSSFSKLFCRLHFGPHVKRNCDFARTFGPPLSHLFHRERRYMARLRRHSPWCFAGPVEQRFTRYEFDKASRKEMGFGALTPLSQEAFASEEEGGTRFGRRSRHSLRPLNDLGLAEVLPQFILSSLRGGRSSSSYFTRRRHQPRASSAPRAKRLRSDALYIPSGESTFGLQ